MIFYGNAAAYSHRHGNNLIHIYLKNRVSSLHHLIYFINKSSVIPFIYKTDDTMINPDDNNLENEDQNDEDPIENLPYGDEDDDQDTFDDNSADVDRLQQAIAASEASFTLDVDKGLPPERDTSGDFKDSDGPNIKQ